MDTLKEIWKPGVDALEGMTAAELAVQKAALQCSLDRLNVIAPNCGHCKHFEMGTCAKHGDVPIEFQRSVGECEDWIYDGVPF